MSRFNLFLLMLVLGCALSVISATNRQRELFIALGRAQSEEHQLAQDWSELQYRQGALSKTTLIERAAQDQLKMQPVTPGRTQYLVTRVAPDMDRSVSGNIGDQSDPSGPGAAMAASMQAAAPVAASAPALASAASATAAMSAPAPVAAVKPRAHAPASTVKPAHAVRPASGAR